MSSAEAEYMAACMACMSISHLRMLIYDLKELGSKNYHIDMKEQSVPDILLVDNEETICMSKNYRPTKKNRHISRRFHYVREGQRTEAHHLHWIPAQDQLADDMTKTQEREKAIKHVDRTLIKLPDHMVVK